MRTYYETLRRAGDVRRGPNNRYLFSYHGGFSFFAFALERKRSTWDGHLQLVYFFFFLFAFRCLDQVYAFFASMIPPLRFRDFLWVRLLVTFSGKHLNVRRIPFLYHHGHFNLHIWQVVHWKMERKGENCALTLLYESHFSCISIASFPGP